jgi:hypothetical protein
MHACTHSSKTKTTTTKRHSCKKKSCGQKISKTMKKLTYTPVRASPFAITKNTKKAMEDPCINQSINRSLGKKKEKNKKKKKPSRMI